MIRGAMQGEIKTEYDLSSAVTFFLVGLGIGSILALLFNPRQRGEFEGLNSNWRKAA
jgi:hypothetical protein